MGSRFNPHSPDHYPVSWLTAANIALKKPEEWVSVDWSRGESGAVSRMKRLRAFRDGILLYPARAPELAKALSEGKALAFRKVLRYGVWDVQVRLTDSKKIEFVVDK